MKGCHCEPNVISGRGNLDNRDRFTQTTVRDDRIIFDFEI